MRNLSQLEATIWSSLFILVAASMVFFSRVFGADAPLSADQVARLGLAIVVLVVAAEIAFHTAFAIVCRGEAQSDERDHEIATKSARNAYYILVTGLMILIGHAGLSAMFGRGNPMEIDMSMMIVLAVLVLVVAEVGHYISRIVYYRRGA